ncbi:helix-turn-helix domain-containing protein [Desulfolutivibrio sulfoxidireducens]|uniref:helix-turn-helix domain-containing protein n=1 Tax=Desulfolutivibrio sulfoxidireducens TaxID=2773299 RepID=UPI00159D3674|nr:helix-turn-helix domain-containing protein [Desulfolutivibrio sulfoxidireducens]QLA15026.1 MerR family transcriptional regulator [Desulfolutivibrio sulfoxidireducens]
MPENRLYSIAAVARLLDVPESTLHYWKNRFHAFLPSLGEGRGRRFRPEAVEVFRDIATGLGRGLSVDEVKAELAERFPVAVSTSRMAAKARGQADPGGPVGTGIEAAAAVFGREMARVLAGFLGGSPDRAGVSLPGIDAASLSAEVEALRGKNQALEAKLATLESELLRLRKDGRELEKYLVEKIRAALASRA